MDCLTRIISPCKVNEQYLLREFCLPCYRPKCGHIFNVMMEFTGFELNEEQVKDLSVGVESLFGHLFCWGLRVRLRFSCKKPACVRFGCVARKTTATGKWFFTGTVKNQALCFAVRCENASMLKDTFLFNQKTDLWKLVTLYHFMTGWRTYTTRNIADLVCLQNGLF